MAKAKKKNSQVALFASVVLPNNSSSNDVEWIMDSDASKHMTSDTSLFTSYDCKVYLVPACL